MRKWILCLMFLSTTVFASDSAMITKVVTLQYQNANTIIHLIQPMLQDGEQVSGSGQTLVLKVMPDTLTQIRNLLHKVDQPPVTFQISIFQGPPDWLSNQGNSIQVGATASQSYQQRFQTVSVTNGEQAFVSTGQDQPVVSSVGVGLWTGVSYNRRLVQNGLLVEPLLQGDQVRINVRRIREQDSNQGTQQFDQQQVNTTVMVPIDQWVPLASAQGGPPVDDPSVNSITVGPQFSSNSTLYIKVSVVEGSGTVSNN